MISLITIPCQSCGKLVDLQIAGSDLPRRADCPNCGTPTYLIAPLGNIPTILIMQRAKWELNNNDTTMAILLSAMAVEAQLSWLFFKWRGIEDDLLPHQQTEAHEEKWEKEWTDMQTISKRSDELSRLLTGVDFDKFAQQNMGWLGSLLEGLNPARSVKDFFQERLFNKRNQIVHYGNLDFDQEDGKSCFSLASTLLRLLQGMDKERIKKMDEDHKQALE